MEKEGVVKGEKKMSLGFVNGLDGVDQILPKVCNSTRHV